MSFLPDIPHQMGVYKEWIDVAALGTVMIGLTTGEYSTVTAVSDPRVNTIYLGSRATYRAGNDVASTLLKSLFIILVLKQIFYNGLYHFSRITWQYL